MKKKIIILGLFFLVLFGAVWIFNHSYIEIIAGNPATDGITYTLVNQENQKKTIIRTNGSKTKKLLPRGVYELTAKSGDSSYFEVKKTGGFLSTTVVNPKLKSEKSRSFIGNNPGECMYLPNRVLISYICGGLFSKVQIHNPATPKSPTFVTRIPSVLESAIEGIVRTDEGQIAILKAPENNEDLGAPQTAYLLGDNLNPNAGVPLSDLSPEKTYTVLNYRKGFLVHDTSLSQVLYYSTRSAKPTPIGLDKPSNSKLLAHSLSVNGDSTAVVYSNNSKGEISTDNKSGKGKIKSEIVIKHKNQVKRIAIKKLPDSVEFCSDTKICVLTQGLLEVYNIAANKPKLLYSVNGVKAMNRLQTAFLIVRENEVHEFNPDSRAGYIQYSMGEYGFCGLQPDVSGYTLCLVNHQGKKTALRIDSTKNNTDSIDQKLFSLSKISEVKEVSAYDRFIYVSPNLGSLVYDPVRNINTYDPVMRKSVNAKINQELVKLGIDRTMYTIINPYDI